MESIQAVMERVAAKMPEEEPSRESLPRSTPSTLEIETAAEDVFSNPEKVPEEYAGARAEHVPQIMAVRFDGGRYGACFFGDAGIGKTYAATALARHLVERLPIRKGIESGKWIHAPNALKWTSAPYLLARIRDTFRKKGGMSEKDIIDECIGAAVFLLDDLGAEKQTEFTGSTLYTILSERRNRRRYTIITTNQRLDEIAEWEPRIASRMAEMFHVKLPDRDRRIGTTN